MKNSKALLAAAAVLAVYAVGSPGVAQAAPVFEVGLNSLFFNNFENLYRTTDSCTANGGCLDSDAGNDPTGFQKVDPTVADNVLVGDVFAGIFNVQNIDSGGTTNFFSGPNNQFTGYFAQEVAAIQLAGADPSGIDHLVLDSPGTDPFGRLAAGEMFQVYVDDGPGATVFESNGTTFDDIAKATDGALWATLGAGTLVLPPSLDPDGYGYTHTDLGVALNPAEPTAFFGLDIVLFGPAYNAGLLALINDVNENEIGGFLAGPSTGPCSPADIGVIACTQIVGTAEIEANPGVTSGSPWLLRSNDPFELLRVVPEPGTVALLGAGLLAIGASFTRRRRSV